MNSFSKGGIQVIDKGNLIYAYCSHPNMGRVQLFKLNSSGFSTRLSSSEDWIRAMLVKAEIPTDYRLEDSILFNNWFNNK
jgi:hypothetical protein